MMLAAPLPYPATTPASAFSSCPLPPLLPPLLPALLLLLLLVVLVLPGTAMLQACTCFRGSALGSWRFNPRDTHGQRTVGAPGTDSSSATCKQA